MLKTYITVILILALFGANISLAIKNSRNIPEDQLAQFDFALSRQNAYVLPVTGPNYIPILDSGVPKPTLNSKSSLIYDTYSKRFLFENNTKSKLPIASLTKILSAVVVLENFDNDEIVTISNRSLKVDGERQDLFLGEKISVRNLLKMMMIESSNDAASAMAEYAKVSKNMDFVEAMNSKARALGMKDSKFFDPAGLDDNGYSTGTDLAKLVEYSLNYKEIWDFSSEKTAIIQSSDDTIQRSITSTNRLLGLINDIFGGKTGYTDGAGQCMIMIVNVPDYQGKIISVVLGSTDRFGDTQKLVDWTRKAYRFK
jgi:D-alanyl-D-alanine carboxypeptidase